MRKCSNCGIELPENAKFCPDCGAPYMPDEGVASAEPEGPQKNICEKCGLELPANAKFCTVCGGKAIMGSAVVAPTKGSFSGAKTVSSGGIMMESVSREDMEKESADEAPETASLGEMGAIPETAEMSAVPQIEELGAAPQVGELGAVPQVGEMGAATQVGEMGAAPRVGELGAVSEIDETPKAPETMTGVSAVPQPVSPVSQPVEASRPISAVSQPVSASQPISASPIIPPVSGTATAVMPGSAPVNNVNTLNPNIQSGAMPAYNAQPAAPGVNLGKSVSAPGATGATGLPGMQVLPNNAPPLGAISSPTKKKMSIGGKIGIIAGSLVAAAAVAAGVFFAVDKASFLSTLMGKEKYAVMVESKAITDAAAKIDAQSISDGVGTMSEVYASMANIGAVDDMTGTMGGDLEDMGGIAPMMYPSVSRSSLQEFDMAAYIKAVNELYVSTYGANHISENMSANVEVGDALKSLIGEDPATVDEIVKIINNTKIDCDVIVDEDAMQMDYAVVLDQAKVDYNVIFNAENEMYMALPFVSDKAFLIKLPVPEEKTEQTPSLNLDKAELERIIKEVVESYLMNYKAAAIEMEKGSVKVADVRIEGKAITAEFKGDSLKKLFTDAVEVIAKDEYLQTEIVRYCQEIGMKDMTAEKFESEMMDAFDFDATDDDKLVITTIIDKQGNILARTFEAFSDTSDETPTIGYFANDKQAAFEIVFGDEGRFVVKTDFRSETDFDMTMDIEYDESVIKLNASCTGVKTAKLGNKEVPVGTYVFSMRLPEDFEDQLGGGAQALAAVNNMTLTISSNVNDDGMGQNMLVRLDAASYGSLQLNVGMTLGNETVGEYPTSLIDLTPMMQQGTPDNATMDQLKAYFDEFGAAYEDLKGKLSGYSVFKELPEFINPFDQAAGPSGPDDYNLTAAELIQYINEDMQELNEYTNLADTSNTELMKRIIELQQDYAELSSTVSMLSNMSENTEGYAEVLADLEEEYWELFDELWDIEIDIDEGGSGSAQKPILPQVDVNSIGKMQYMEIQEIMEAYNAVFEMIEDNEDFLIKNNDLQKLYDAAEEEYADVEHDWEYFYNDLKRGTLNVSLLNTVRNSMKKYVPAVDALVQALQAEGLM